MCDLQYFLDLYLLDVFVFEEFEKLLNKAKTDKGLNSLLRSDKIIFFLQYIE